MSKSELKRLNIQNGRNLMNVLEIVDEYLVKNGFDGLFESGVCACEAGDLAPCGNIGNTCEPGYKKKCDCGDHSFHIGPKRLVE